MFLAGLLYALDTWQTRSMLPDQAMAPDFRQQTIQGETVTLSDFAGKKKAIYFFAPWCNVCTLTIGALENLDGPENKDSLAIIAVGLSYNNVSELSEFVSRHNLDATVVAGNEQIAGDFRIQAFPTLYILDENNRVSSQSMGLKTRADLALLKLQQVH